MRLRKETKYRRENERDSSDTHRERERESASTLITGLLKNRWRLGRRQWALVDLLCVCKSTRCSPTGANPRLAVPSRVEDIDNPIWCRASKKYFMQLYVTSQAPSSLEVKLALAGEAVLGGALGAPLAGGRGPLLMPDPRHNLTPPPLHM